MHVVLCFTSIALLLHITYHDSEPIEREFLLFYFSPVGGLDSLPTHVWIGWDCPSRF